MVKNTKSNTAYIKTMNNLTFFVLLIFSCNLFAEGKLTVRQPFYSEENNYGLEVGLYVREPIAKSRFFYQSWTGGQMNNYFVSNQDLMFSLAPTLSIGIGGSYRKEFNQIPDYQGSVVIEMKLW